MPFARVLAALVSVTSRECFKQLSASTAATVEICRASLQLLEMWRFYKIIASCCIAAYTTNEC